MLSACSTNQFKIYKNLRRESTLIHAKNNARLRLSVQWSGLKLKCIRDKNDEVVVHGLSCRVKYCRIVKRIFNGKTRFFVQLILEGTPFIKEKNEYSDNIVGLDIGPSTIAYVSKKQANAKIESFCDELSLKQKEIRRLQRALERKRRANNLENYNPEMSRGVGSRKAGLAVLYMSFRPKRQSFPNIVISAKSIPQSPFLNAGIRVVA